MLGGLIAGALGGASSAIGELADRVMKEADDAKRMAFETGMVNFRIQADRENATTAFERQKELRADEQDFQLGNTVLASQLAGERQENQNRFTAEENQKNRNASSANSGRRSVSEEAQAELLNMKRAYLDMPAGPDRDKLAADIKFFEGKTDRAPDYMTVKNELGAEEVYMKTPNGLVKARMDNLPSTNSPGGNSPSGNTGATRPSIFMKPAPPSSSTGSETSEPVPMSTTVNQGPRQIRPGNSGDIIAARDSGIREGMMSIQQQMIKTKDVNERLRLAEEYSNLAKMLQR